MHTKRRLQYYKETVQQKFVETACIRQRGVEEAQPQAGKALNHLLIREIAQERTWRS